MDVLNRLRSEARTKQATIVFPEGEDSRILRAAAYLARERIVQPILLGRTDTIARVAAEAKLDMPLTVEILDPTVDVASLHLVERVRHLGMGLALK